MNHYFSQTSSVAILSLVKLFERFSYYGMRTLLVLYVIEELGIDRSNAFTYYGAFTAGVYLANLPMSLISDLLLKQKWGIFTGFIFLIIGYLTLIIPEKIAMLTGLVLIIIGGGFVNANMVVFLGRLFKKQDKNRNAGFIAYLTGINIGAFLASLVLAFIGEKFGYQYGFGIAGFSAIISLAIFSLCMNRFNLIELNDFSTSKPSIDNHPEILDYTPSAGSVRGANPPPIPGYRATDNIFGRHAIISGICFVAVLFWQLYEISSIQLYANFGSGTVIDVLGFSLPGNYIYSAQFIFLLPVSIIVLILLLNGKLRSSINMIGVGFFALAINLGFIYLSTNGIMIFLTLVSSFVAIAIAEIFMTAVALSYMTRLNNVRFASTVIGAYFLITGIGSKIFSYFQIYYEEINLLILAIAPIVVGLVFILGRKLLLQLSGGMD